MLEYKARITSLDNLKAELPGAIEDTITGSNELQELLRGKDGKDAGRYLGKATRIRTSLNDNYIPEEDSYFFHTADVGDYVYLTTAVDNWRKDTYYIVRERKSSTVWEEYNIKGRSPEVYLGSDYYLYVDGVQQQYLKGDPGDKGADGHTPVLSLDRQYRLRADGELVSQYSLKPSAKEVVGTSEFAEQLRVKIEGSEKIKTLETGVNDTKKIAQNSHDLVIQFDNHYSQMMELQDENLRILDSDVTKANNSITDLGKRSLTSDQRDEVAYLTSSLPQLKNSNNEKLQALDLQRYITLSRDGDNISAYLASDALTAVLKAGITNFGTPQEKENVAINHNGTGHFGNLYFAGNQIDFRIDQKTEPYLSVGAEEADFIDNFLNSARVDNTPVSISSTTLPDRNKLPDSSAYTLARTLSVANEGTRLTISIDSLKVETYKPNKAYLVLDGVVLDTWQGSNSSKIVRHPDGTVEADITQTPYTASNLIYERTVAKGTHMVQIILETPNSSDKVTLSGFKVRQRYDTGLQQSLLTKSGLRLYGSPQRYLDVDYRKQYYNTAPGAAVGWITNDYTLRVKGGAKIDRLEVDKITGAGAKLSPIVTPQLSWGGQSTIYPKYDDWVLTSDARAQYISFSGLTAEIGRSIYVQTRRKAYLYANGHSFYGLPGDANKGTAVDQWLANNTTYRFVRASSDSWFVTASSSPYPWT